MQLLDHVSVAVTDLARARPFYDAIMAPLAAEKVYDHEDALGYGARCRAESPAETYLAVYASVESIPGSRRHWCFKAPSQTAVDAFHAAALAHGGRCDGPPGFRPSYHAHYYAAFVLDPDGNRLEAVCHVR
jgi:catechol 2,3-dioxygenase-like lactoylglutathione lyase family enzyme